MIRRLLADTNAQVFNLDNCGYASNLTSIEQVLKILGPGAEGRHQLLRVDLAEAEATAAAMQRADPDLVLHLAAESHVDRSIARPGAFISSNVNGTFHLLQAVRSHWEALPESRPTTPAAPTPPARRPATTSCGPGITPMECRWCLPTAAITTGPGSTRRS